MKQSLAEQVAGSSSDSSGGSGDTDAPGDTDVNGDLDKVQLTIDEQFPTVVHVTWESPTEGTSLVEYGLDGALIFISGAVHPHRKTNL